MWYTRRAIYSGDLIVMTCLLVLDASSSLCSVALQADGRHWHITEEQPRRHAQRLLPMVDDILRQADISKSAIHGIAYGRGPGSFTGIRIAASVMQGIALALNIPVAGISSLQAVAHTVFLQTDTRQVMAIMDAHMGEVFWGCYERTGDSCRLIGAEQVGAPAQCLQAIHSFTGTLAGDGLQLPALAHLNQLWANVQPQADIMLPLALLAWQRGEFSDPQEHQPVYLRESVAWKKLDEQPSLLKRD